LFNHVLFIHPRIDTSIHMETKFAMTNVIGVTTVAYFLNLKQLKLLRNEADCNEVSDWVKTAPCDFLCLLLPLIIVLVLQVPAKVEILNTLTVYKYVRNSLVVCCDHYHVT